MLDKDNSGKGVAKFKLIGGTIKANQPFLIQIYDEKDGLNLDNVEFAGKTIKYSANPQDVDDDSETKLVGTYKGIIGYNDEFVKGKQWYMAISNGTWYSSATGYTRPTGAYLDIELNGSEAPIIYIEDPETGTTGIMEMDVEKKALSTEGWYTVSGVKLQGAPTQKGVYIKDDKKVIIK